VEIVVTLSIIVILASILIAAINPNAILKRSRDVRRVQDLDTIDKAIQVMKIEISNFDELNYASQNIVYISLKDSSTTCGSYINELPSLPSGWQYRCSNSPTNIDGTGWIPFPFNQVPLLTLSKLPVDPINKPPYYYAFIVGGSFSLFTMLEDTQRTPNSKNDGDNFPHLYSTVNSNKNLINQAQGLVGYWSFDEGSGNIARDYSGNGNDGEIRGIGLDTNWVAGKVNGAIQYLSTMNTGCVGQNAGFGKTSGLSTSLVNLPQGNFTVAMWVKLTTKITTFHLVTPYGRPGCSNAGIGGCDSVCSSLGCINMNIPNLAGDVWKFYVYVFKKDANQQLNYINGALVNSSNLQGGNYGNISEIYLGLYWWSCLDASHGLFDEFRIYNRALSDSEIKALYEATK
jgi:hypothetical protein